MYAINPPHTDNGQSLFRVAAIRARQTELLGGIVLIRPMSFAFITALAVVLAGVVVAFAARGTYTKRSTVSGQLVPNSGLIKVYVPQAGIVLKKNVAEGQAVTQGQVLYVLSSDRQSSTQGNTQAAISKQVEVRRLSLRDEFNTTRQLQQQESAALVRKIAGLQTEILNLDDQIRGQRNRTRLGEQAVSRVQGLAAQGFLSSEAVQQKQADLLDQQTRLQSLERDRISVARELVAQQNDLKSVPLRQANVLAQIDRSITAAGQELTESEAKRRLVITAPETGTATGVVAEVGQSVDINRALVSIVPSGATLQAHLYVPSKSVGFVKPGDSVLLRYQAYPYQKFGQYRGTVATVSRTALPASELTGVSSLAGTAGGAVNEPIYRVIVDLSAQSVTAYGKRQPLQAGILLDADVLQDTRRLYEWALEPLYSLSGKL